jgi:hypothetical protein
MPTGPPPKESLRRGEVGVEVLGACALERHEVPAEVRPQSGVGRCFLVDVAVDAVQHVGPAASDGTAEHLGVRIDRKGFGF